MGFGVLFSLRRTNPLQFWNMVKGRKSSWKNRHLSFVVDKKFSDPAKENMPTFTGHQASLIVWDCPGFVTESLSHSWNP